MWAAIPFKRRKVKKNNILEKYVAIFPKRCMLHFGTSLSTCCYFECCVKQTLLFSKASPITLPGAGLSDCTQVSNSALADLWNRVCLCLWRSKCGSNSLVCVSFLLLCVWRRYTDDSSGVSPTVNRASGSHILNLLIYRHSRWRGNAFSQGFFFSPTVKYLFILWQEMWYISGCSGVVFPKED